MISFIITPEKIIQYRRLELFLFWDTVVYISKNCVIRATNAGLEEGGVA